MKTRRFFKSFLLTTLIALILTTIFTALGLTRELTLQYIAGVLDVIIIPLIFIQTLLIFACTNRGDELGRKLLKLNYITIIVVGFCLSLLMVAGILNSFSTDPASTSLLGQTLAAYLFATILVLEMGITIVCYLILPFDRVWSFSS